jgi:hypothetical protein
MSGESREELGVSLRFIDFNHAIQHRTGDRHPDCRRNGILSP